MKLKEGRLPNRKTVMFKVDKGTSTMINVYGIGWLNRLTGIAQQTIRKWERTGVLPSPILPRIGGNRWYTALEIAGYAKVIQQREGSAARWALNTLKVALGAEHKACLQAYTVAKRTGKLNDDMKAHALVDNACN